MGKAFFVAAAFAFLLVSCTAREEVSVIEPETAPAEEPEAPAPRTREPRVREPELRPVVRQPARADMRRVRAETLNVRSGPNINYEVLGVLSKDDQVVAVSTQFEWVEIQLPASFKGWVHSDYVELSSEFSEGRRVSGRVNATRLNVRALPGTTYSVISQISRGDRVNVIDKSGEWLGIDVSGIATGWVHSQHLETMR